MGAPPVAGPGWSDGRRRNMFESLEVEATQESTQDNVQLDQKVKVSQELKVEATNGYAEFLNTEVHSNLLSVPVQVGDMVVQGLLDSGASHNFVSRAAVRENGWVTTKSSPLSVKMANKTVVQSSETCQLQIQVGALVQVVMFQVLDSSLDMVLGMPWLSRTNPRIDWDQRLIRIYRKGRWLSLPVWTDVPCWKQVVQHSQSVAGNHSVRGLGLTDPALASSVCHGCSTNAKDLEVQGTSHTLPDVNRKFILESANQFAKSLRKADEVFIGLVNSTGDLGFTHRTAFGDKGVEKVGSAKSEWLLDELQSTYPKVFSEPEYPITEGCVPFEIKLVDSVASPPKRKLYPLNEPELKELKTQLTSLLDSGRIVPSASPYWAPILFAAKKAGQGLRMCVDYQSLNANTITDQFPLPRIDDLLSRLRGARIFSKLDLRDGYHQIPVAAHDCHKTAFNCRYGAFEFRVMPFGLKNAPAHFQRTMNQLLSDLVDVCVLAYLDDILVFSRDKAEHQRHIHLVFDRSNAANFHVKRVKCSMFAPTMEFLGHVVSERGIEVCPEKVSAIRDWLQPQSVRGVQSFLGLCNYFRRFVRNFAKIAVPLTNLTRKAIEFVWSKECQHAFETLKTCLLTAPVLMVYDPDRPCEVWCDASNWAVGAVLMQLGDDGYWKPVEYLSKHLNSAEVNYSATEREFVGVIQSLRTWRHYLLGKKVTVRTDHASLQYLTTQPHLSRRQVCWLEFLSEFDLNITHVPGKANVVADALS